MEFSAYAAMAEAEETHWWFVARRRIMASLLSRLSLPSGAPVLEAGCGSGGNLAMLSAFGEVYALELNEYARARAISRGIARRIESAELPGELPFDEKFGLIAMFDVLEHVSGDVAALERLAPRLLPGGKLAVTVPAFPFLWSAHDEMHHHWRRYTAASLRAALERAGYRVEYISYFNFWLFPAVAAARLGKKRPGAGNAGDLAALPPRWLNGLLTHIFASERHFMGKIALPFGVSLAAVASIG